mgnify:CR=1 FL=1
MIIGLDTIGDFHVQSKIPTSNNNKVYQVEMQNVISDELYISQSGEIQNTSKFDWKIDTFLKATFQNNLEAGNVSLGGLQIDRWKVRRRKIEDINFKDLALVPMGSDENFYYLDTSAQTNVIYEYEVIPMSGDIEGVAHVVQIKIDFEYWWLSGEEESYPFFANLQVSDITTNRERHEYLGFNKYPVVSYGNAKYQSGTITALLVDSFVETNFNYRKKVEDFINNGKFKYLRSPYGDVWRVDTHTCRRTPIINAIMDNIDDLSTISFDWVEVDDA